MHYNKTIMDGANNLKNIQPQFYNVLYEKRLEMMYFLIESVITRNSYFNIANASDDKIIEVLKGMMQS